MKKEYTKDVKEEVREDSTEQKFPLSTLRNNSVALFGVTSSSFDGATKNIESKEYSKTEMARIIKDWLGKEAK